MLVQEGINTWSLLDKLGLRKTYINTPQLPGPPVSRLPKSHRSSGESSARRLEESLANDFEGAEGEWPLVFCRVSLGFTWVSLGFHLGFPWFHLVSLGFPGFFWVSLGFHCLFFVCSFGGLRPVLLLV